MPGWQVHLLGDAYAACGQERVPFLPDQRYQLLAYLAYCRERVGREQLAHLFWPDRPDKGARRNFRKLLYKVRRLDWLEGFEADDHGARWPVDTDVVVFQEAIGRQDWHAALPLYRGPLLRGADGDENEFDTWLTLERQRLESLWRDAVLAHADALEHEGRFRQAAAALTPLLEHDAFDEQACWALVRALLEAGDRQRALRTYHTFRTRLADELGLEPTSAFQQFARAAEVGEGVAAPQSRAPSTVVVSARPPSETSFVGRVAELSELSGLLAESGCRFLTLVGPGGIGKTRLALRAVHELAPNYRDGACFVALDALTSPEAIPLAVANALELTLSGPGDAAAQLVRVVAERQLLLVLDNYEHLLAGALLVTELLRGCPDLQLLVTSRERLKLTEEWLLPVGGLPFPTGPASLAEAQTFDAVRLFVACARRVRPDLALDPETLPHILDVCRLLDGAPLGLELAATWSRLLSPADIAKELARDLDFLAAERRDASERHQSLRATFEHSWRLLTPDEQAALRKLSVFRGGFTREAADYVADATLPLLASLVDKSLLRFLPSERYDRHPLIYQYTLEKLTEHPEEEAAARRAHAAFYAELVVGSHKLVRGGQQRAFIQKLVPEHDNLRAMWTWSVARRDERLIGKAVKSLMAYLTSRGLRREALALLEQAAETVSETKSVRVMILNRQSALYLTFGRWQEARARLNEARRLAGVRGAPLERAITYMQLGRVSDMMGDYDDAERQWETCRDLFRKLDRTIAISEITHALGLVAHHKGELQEAVRLQRESLAIKERLGHASGIAVGQAFLGDVHLDLEAYDEARACFERSLDAYRGLGNDHGVAEARKGLAIVAMRTGRLLAARRHLRACLQVFRAQASQPRLVETLSSMGDLERCRRHEEDARRCYREALAIARQTELTPLILHALSRLVPVSDLSPMRKLALVRYLGGHSACTASVKRYLRAATEVLSRDLPDGAVRAGRAAPASLTLEAVLAEVASS